MLLLLLLLALLLFDGGEGGADALELAFRIFVCDDDVMKIFLALALSSLLVLA